MKEPHGQILSLPDRSEVSPIKRKGGFGGKHLQSRNMKNDVTCQRFVTLLKILHSVFSSAIQI